MYYIEVLGNGNRKSQLRRGTVVEVGNPICQALFVLWLYQTEVKLWDQALGLGFRFRAYDLRLHL